MEMHKINNILAREIIDSRGNPTIEVDVITSDGTFGRASAPAGASTGQNEAIELRDNDPNRYNKKGVLSAIEKIDTEITPKLIGIDVSSQEKIDNTLLEIDSTQNKSILGGNTTVAFVDVSSKSLLTSHADNCVNWSLLFSDNLTSDWPSLKYNSLLSST